MIPSEATGMIHYLTPENPSSMIMQPNFQAFQLNAFLNTNFQAPLLTNIPEYTAAASPLPPSYLSNTSDEAEELGSGIIDERKQRRMISNRESARRSRMRKQRHLDELWSQVVRLRTENNNLVEKLSSFSDSQDKMVKENARLNEEVSDLRRMLRKIQVRGPYDFIDSNDGGFFDDLEDVHLREESSGGSNISSI